jgi:CRP-like cAMP-binding protein
MASVATIELRPAFSARARAGRGSAGGDRRHETLDGIRILAGLSPAARRALAAQCLWREVGPRQQIVGQQEDSRSVFFLVAGKAHAATFSEDGKRVTFHDIRAGEMFGEFAAIDGAPQAATVEAAAKCTVAALPAEAFWELLRAEPAVMAEVMKHLAGQARRLSKKVFDLSTLAVGKRIQAELLRLAESSMTERGNAVLFPAPTDADIASHVAATRETVNRQIGEMIEAGVVERRGRRTLVIPDVDKVRRLIAASASDWPQRGAKRLPAFAALARRAANDVSAYGLRPAAAR